MKLFIILHCCAAYKQFNWYYDNRIHNFGNIGIGGKFHSFMAPYSSKIIDKIAYNGMDIRLESVKNTKIYSNYENPRILDIGCGVGISTKSLKKIYPEANIYGIDCSISMLNNCEKKSGIKYIKNFAHKTSFMDNSFDIINSMFLFHEVPQLGRKELLNEIDRILCPGGLLNILDIRLKYTPNSFMLSGEPFLLDYLENFEEDLSSLKYQEVNKLNTNSKQFDKLYVKPFY